MWWYQFLKAEGLSLCHRFLFLFLRKEGLKDTHLSVFQIQDDPESLVIKRSFEKKYAQDFVARFIINFLHIGFLPSFFLIYGILIQNLLGHQYSVHVHYKCVSVVFFRLHYVYTKKQRCVQIKATIYAYG